MDGSPSGFFSSKRGLRQGSSLYPFLFILAMKGLSVKLRTSKYNDMLRWFKVNPGDNQGLSISHLPYIDDTLVFCDAESDLNSNNWEIFYSVWSHYGSSHQLGEEFCLSSKWGARNHYFVQHIRWRNRRAGY